MYCFVLNPQLFKLFIAIYEFYLPLNIMSFLRFAYRGSLNFLYLDEIYIVGVFYYQRKTCTEANFLISIPLCIIPVEQ